MHNKKEKIRKRKDTKENKEFWDNVEKISKETRETFPLWKINEELAEEFKKYR